MRILVTGGVGYIGSHTVVELQQRGHEVVIVDNLCNSKVTCLDRVEEITGQRPEFYRIDICEADALRTIFGLAPIDAVIHFAGLKAVGESVSDPRRYYENNVGGTLSLLEVMDEFDVRTLVFSSSATVYGDPASVPIREDFPLTATNPYGWSKLMVEQILRDHHQANANWNMCLLRYFNPVGAHSSGRIGEDPNGIPNNLLPYIAQVAVGRLDSLKVFGNDYPTSDGTGVRDYIHVVDLALGHLAALETHRGDSGVHVYNLGTGRGISVLEMLRAFEKACGQSLAYEIVERREGDIAECWADPSHATQALNWRAERTVEQMTADAWRWQSENPDGFPNREC